ncbi:unnamed protein product, partial [Tilletia controversa]
VEARAGPPAEPFADLLADMYWNQRNREIELMAEVARSGIYEGRRLTVAEGERIARLLAAASRARERMQQVVDEDIRMAGQ